VSTSAECLRRAAFPILGTGKLYHASKVATSSEIKTIRDFTNMTSYYSGVILNGTSPTTVVTMVPSGVVNNLTVGFMNYMRSVFLYWRGGMRLVIFGQKDIEATVDVSFDAVVGGSRSGAVVQQSFTANAPITFLTGDIFSALTPRTDYTPMDYTLPYYAPVKSLLNQTVGTAFVEAYHQPELTVALKTTTLPLPTSYDNMAVFLGGGDDFMLGYRLPSPLQNYVAPTDTEE